jgi:acyl-CoA thioesterase-1
MSRAIGFLLVLGLALGPPAMRAAAPGPAGAIQGADQRAPVILVFGDSISAGYGIRVEQGWVRLLARRIAQLGYGFEVVNASVSGETTAGGLARLPHALERQPPRIVILELGGNDGLRGLPLAGTRNNLQQMITRARAQGAAVLLLGMRLPPNYGERYTDDFQMMYTQLAERNHIPLVPFLLEKVALNPALMQADGIHPTEQGQPLLLDSVWPKLEPLLREAAGAAEHRAAEHRTAEHGAAEH